MDVPRAAFCSVAGTGRNGVPAAAPVGVCVRARNQLVGPRLRTRRGLAAVDAGGAGGPAQHRGEGRLWRGRRTPEGERTASSVVQWRRASAEGPDRVLTSPLPRRLDYAFITGAPAMSLASLYVTTFAACAVLGPAAWGLGRRLEAVRPRRRGTRRRMGAARAGAGDAGARVVLGCPARCGRNERTLR